MIIYIAGPLMDGHTLGPRESLKNVRKAMRVYIQLLKKGHIPILPHFSYFAWIEEEEDIPWEAWMTQDYELLNLCDAMFYIGSSKGADIEFTYALKKGMIIYQKIEDVETTPITPVDWDVIKK